MTPTLSPAQYADRHFALKLAAYERARKLARVERFRCSAAYVRTRSIYREG